MINQRVTIQQLKANNIKLFNYTISISEKTMYIDGYTSFIYGLGERYNAVNQKGFCIKNMVEEQFCNQGMKTYYPLPFFLLEMNTGVFINTKKIFDLNFENGISIDISNLEDYTEIYVLSGSHKEIISDFITITGEPLLPPKWILGPWMSAHRWNSQDMVLKQVDKVKKLQIPVTALVIEQWSDESTFYCFNESEHPMNKLYATYDEFDYKNSKHWPDPKKMVDEIHSEGIKVLLWQAPVIKELEPKDVLSLQHELDQNFVKRHNFIVRENKKVYQIPKGKWFPGSMIPDFTNPEMVEWWFKKRQYLTDIGIDGFKTDGGEFVHSLSATFFCKENGTTMTNDYSRLYVSEYKKHLNQNQVLFSRAGYIGQQSNTILWAGDQKSTWDELKSVYNSGLSTALSGHHLWSFDIGGFAGDLPSKELYIRSTQLAVFSPVMQFHSEPIGGQFALLDPSKEMNNERSPWNISEYYNDTSILEICRKFYWLRMNLVPYIYSELIKSVREKSTLMKHLIIDFPNEKEATIIDTQHMFGNLMVVPILSNCSKVKFYLPKGEWINIFTKEVFPGGCYYERSVNLDEMLVFVPIGTAIVTKNQYLFENTSNEFNVDTYYFHLYGKNGEYTFVSDEEEIYVSWSDGQYTIKSKANVIIVFE